MFVTTLKLVDQNLIAVPANKTISCIEYTDGTCDMHLDLPNDILALIYQKASDENISAEEAATELVTRALENYICNENNDQDIESSTSNQKKD